MRVEVSFLPKGIGRCLSKMVTSQTRVCGGSLNTDSAIVSADGSFIFVPSGAAVRMYSSLTGDRVAELHGHAADVTAICVDPADTQQIYSSSMDCTIRKWNFSEEECVACIQLEAPVVNMVMAGPDTVVASLQCRGGDAGRVGTYCLKTKRWKQLLRLSSPSRALALSPSKQYIATFERHTLHIVQISPNESQAARIKLSHTKRFTCVAFDCTNQHIAAGDASGRINIWTGLEAATATAAHNTGGHEGVLVIWQLATLGKEFLPRLGGGLCHISPFPNDPTQYVLGFDSNVTRCVSISSMQAYLAIYGIRPSPVGAANTVANRGVTIQPGSGYLVLPCVGSQLQLYDCVHDVHVARVQVSKRNTSSFSDEQNNASSSRYCEPAVELADFTHDGETLVTLESMPFESASSGDRWHSLKFWDVHSTGSGQTGYTVNSVVNDPHFGHITSLACHPHEVLVATTCASESARVSEGGSEGGSEGASGQKEGGFRLWRKRHFKRTPGAPPDAPTWHWRCTSVSSYKDSVMHCCAFSQDGSTLAVGGASCTTLWTCQNKFVASLVCPFRDAPDSRVAHVCFIPGSPYLVTAHTSTKEHSQGLCVWNLLTLTLHWAGKFSVHDLVAHPTLQRFACIFGTGKNRIVAELDTGGHMISSWGETASDKPSRVLYGPAASALSSCRLGTTPLLVVSEGRRAMVIASGAQSSVEQSEQARIDGTQSGEPAERRAASGSRDGKLFEMFGDDRTVPSSEGGVDWDAGVKQRARAAALAAVLPFQAESHLLPAPAELCSRVLWALAGADNDEL